MAISVGSVEVDVIPNTRGIYQRLRSELVPAATRVGEDAGNAAGRSFGPAMQAQVGEVGLRIGQQIGQQIAARITAEIRGALRDGVTQGGAAARASAVRQGDQTGGAFSRALKTRLEAAFRSLPQIDIDANTSAADADLQALRVRMETLANKRIGIDIDAGAAKAEIKLIEAELTRLGSQHPNVQVRADTASARAELVAVRAQIDAVDGKRARIDVDTSGALSAVLQLAVAIGGLAAIPAIPVLAAGIGSIAAAGVAAGAGIGALGAVAIPAFKGIAGALQAQKSAQDAATNASYKGGQASGQGAAQALQLAGAQQALASAHRNAARQIGQAEQAVGDAVRSSAEANRQAAQQVRAAKQSLADAVQQAADRQQQAAEAVARAEDSLADAQRTARQAQQDLTQARKDAAVQLAELADRVANAQLSERDAVLDVQEARARLRATQAQGSKATVLEQQRAQLALDQAVQRLKEQKEETKRLSGEKAAADKAGVEGSDLVKSAQQRVADAEKAVADQQKGVAKARADAAKQQLQSQRDIASAQEKVAEASRNVSKVQEDGARSVQRAQESLVAAQQSAADSIASAQRQIASASQSAAGGVDQAAVAQAKYQAELAKLSPATRDTFNSFLRLRDAFKAWSTSLQPKVMPIFTRALDGLRRSLPGLTPFVEGAVRAITKLQDRVSQGFKSPWWKSFKGDLARSVEPAITGLGVSFGRVFVGMAGVIQAFLPHMDTISTTMQRITGRFADWGKNLKGSPEFERFLSYAATQGPVLARTIGDISSAFYQVSRALAPLSGPVLEILGALARGVASIASTLPWLIQGLYLAFIATRVWTLAMLAFNLVMAANPITLIIIGIVALVAAVVYAYKNFGWFRTAVQAAWSGIQTAISFAWNSILKPAFNGIWSGLQTIGRWGMWLWNIALKPAWDAISLGARILATLILTILITPLVLGFKMLAAIAMELWTNFLSPIFGWIGEKASWLWNSKIKPAWDQLKVGTGLVGAKVKELWNSYVRPVFQWIGDKASWLWSTKIKPAWDRIKIGTGLVGDKIRELWNKYASPVFGWIGDKGKRLWDKALKPAFDNIKKGVKAVGDSFRDAKDFIGRQWSKVQDIAKKPVRFIIDKVYNAGIVPTWNKIASAFGAPKIRPMETKGWATGGVLPGYTPGRDVHSFYSPTGGGLELSGGEAIMRPEFTRAVGPGFVAAMNRIASSRGPSGVRDALGGTQQFKDGGIFSWLGNAAAGVGSKAWEGIKKGTSWLKDNLEASARAGVNAVVNPLLAKFPGGSGDFGKMIRRIPTKILDSIFGYSKKADKKMTPTVNYTPSKGVEQWRPIVVRSLSEVGQPASLADTTLRRMQQESGGNPTIVNKWDSNWQAGYPSVGLMQVIGPTFRSYAGKYKHKGPFSYGVSVDPLANIYSSMKYALGSYGSLSKAYNRAGGYDSGGYLQPGLNLAYNGTGRPEPVFTTAQAQALTSRATTTGLGDLNVKVFVGNEELSHIARTEVWRANGELVQVLNAGGGM